MYFLTRWNRPHDMAAPGADRHQNRIFVRKAVRYTCAAAESPIWSFNDAVRVNAALAFAGKLYLPGSLLPLHRTQFFSPALAFFLAAFLLS